MAHWVREMSCWGRAQGTVHALRNFPNTFSGAFRLRFKRSAANAIAEKKNTFRVTNYDPLAIIRVVEILNYSRFTFAYTERDA